MQVLFPILIKLHMHIKNNPGYFVLS
jgi:hypothetical protein